MAQITRIEKRKRGFFGWIFLILFWGFNIAMIFSLFAGVNETAQSGAQLSGDAERAGHAIGTAIGVGMLLAVWAFGSIILGFMVMMTRGKKVIVETVA